MGRAIALALVTAAACGGGVISMAGDSVEVELPEVPGGDLVPAPGNF